MTFWFQPPYCPLFLLISSPSVLSSVLHKLKNSPLFLISFSYQLHPGVHLARAVVLNLPNASTLYTTPHVVVNPPTIIFIATVILLLL